MKKIISFGVNIFSLLFWAMGLLYMIAYGLFFRSIEPNITLLVMFIAAVILMIFATYSIKVLRFNHDSLTITRPLSIFLLKSKVLFNEQYQQIKAIRIIYGGLTGVAKIEIDLINGSQIHITSIEFIFYSKKKLCAEFLKRGIETKLFSLGLKKERIEVS